MLLSLITLKGLKTPKNSHFDIVKSQHRGDIPDMGTGFRSGGYVWCNGASGSRVTYDIKKIWLVKVERLLKRPKNPETPENRYPETPEAASPTTTGALCAGSEGRLPRGAAYGALVRGLLLEPRHRVDQVLP